ncbi:uncharacterized protein LOC108678337 [Hyalella azteca]|uniref:Uncharacterized protein LOC108678337 n=1 Tax=Hyalella azteca TaxID=294128 RepID=A0A8B7P8S6_HYAAZ|nr:uncharacterized protein LOC108678337 [Hyalella azteca]
MLGAPLLAGAIYAGASAPNVPGTRRQDQDAGGADEPYWQRLIQRTVGNIRNTASYVEGQVRDFFELDGSRDQTTDDQAGEMVGVVPGNAPPGIVQLNQNQVLRPRRRKKKPTAAGNQALAPNGDMQIRLPYIDGSPVFHNIRVLDQLGTAGVAGGIGGFAGGVGGIPGLGGQVGYKKSATGHLHDPFTPVRQENNPVFYTPEGHPFRPAVNSPQVLGSKKESDGLLEQGIENSLLHQHYIDAGVPVSGQVPGLASLGSQRLHSEQYVRIAETGQVVPLRALHPQLLETRLQSDTLPVRRFDGALSRQLSAPELLALSQQQESIGLNGNVRQSQAVNSPVLISERRRGIDSQGSENFPERKSVQNSSHFLGNSGDAVPMVGPGLQMVDGTVQYQAEDGKMHLLGITAGNEKVKRRKRPTRPGKNKNLRLKNVRKDAPKLPAISIRPNQPSINLATNLPMPSISAHEQRPSPHTFAMLPETKADDFNAHDPLTVQLRSYNHKYTGSSEERQQSPNSHRYLLPNSISSHGQVEQGIRQTQQQISPHDIRDFMKVNMDSPGRKTTDASTNSFGNYTTRFRVIDYKEELRIAKEKLNISNLENVGTASMNYGNLKPESVISKVELESINKHQAYLRAMKKQLPRFTSKELIEHRPPEQKTIEQLKPLAREAAVDDFLDPRNRLIVGGDLYRKAYLPDTMSGEDISSISSLHSSQRATEHDKLPLYRGDFSSHPIMKSSDTVDSVPGASRISAKLQNDITRPPNRTNSNDKMEGPKQLDIDTSDNNLHQSKIRADSKDPTEIKPSPSSTRTADSEEEPLGYPFYKFKNQGIRPPSSIQDVIALTMGAEPAHDEGRRDHRNSLEFNRFKPNNPRASPRIDKIAMTQETEFPNDYNYDYYHDRLPLHQPHHNARPKSSKTQGLLYHQYKERKHSENSAVDHALHSINLGRLTGTAENSALKIQPASFEVFDIIADESKKRKKTQGYNDGSAVSDMKVSDRNRNQGSAGVHVSVKSTDGVTTLDGPQNEAYLPYNSDSFLHKNVPQNPKPNEKVNTRINSDEVDYAYDREIAKQDESDYVFKSKDKIKTLSEDKENRNPSTISSVRISTASNPVAEESYGDSEYDETPGLRRRKIVGSNLGRPFRRRRPSSTTVRPASVENKNDESISFRLNNRQNLPRKSLSAELGDYIRTKTKLPQSVVTTQKKSDITRDSEEDEIKVPENNQSADMTQTRSKRRKPIGRKRLGNLPAANQQTDDELTGIPSAASSGLRRRRRPLENPTKNNPVYIEDKNSPPFAQDYTDPESRYRTRDTTDLEQQTYEERYMRRKNYKIMDRQQENMEKEYSVEGTQYPDDDDMSVSPSVKNEATRNFMGIKRNSAPKFGEFKKNYDTTIELLKAKRDSIGPKSTTPQQEDTIPSSPSPFLPTHASRGKVKRNHDDAIADRSNSSVKEPHVITIDDISGQDNRLSPRINPFTSTTPSGPSFMKRIQDISDEDNPIISNLKAVFLENANEHHKPMKTSFWHLGVPRTTEPVEALTTSTTLTPGVKKVRRKKLRNSEYSQISRMGLPLNSVEIITGKISNSNPPRTPHLRQHGAFLVAKTSSNTAPDIAITAGGQINEKEEIEDQYESLSDLMPMRLVAPHPETLNSVTPLAQVGDNFSGKTMNFNDEVRQEDIQADKSGAAVNSVPKQHETQMEYGESFTPNKIILPIKNASKFAIASEASDESLVAIGEIQLPGTDRKIIVKTPVPEFFNSGPGSVVDVFKNTKEDQVDKASDVLEQSTKNFAPISKRHFFEPEPYHPTTDRSSLASFPKYLGPKLSAKTFMIEDDSLAYDQLSTPTREESQEMSDTSIAVAQSNIVSISTTLQATPDAKQSAPADDQPNTGNEKKSGIIKPATDVDGDSQHQTTLSRVNSNNDENNPEVQLDPNQQSHKIKERNLNENKLNSKFEATQNKPLLENVSSRKLTVSSPIKKIVLS